MDKMIFLILSFATGVLELGVVWYGLNYSEEPTIALIFVLAYQLGNLAFIKKGKVNRRAIGVAIFGMIVLLCSSFYSGKFLIQLICEGFVVFASSLVLQTAREKLKSECATGIKRLCRIAGFLISPIMTIVPNSMLMMFLLFSTMTLLARGISTKETGKNESVKHKVIFTMVFHQTHYFVYTYVFLGWFNCQIKLMGITRSEWIAAIGFAITWLVYMMPEVISRIRKSNNYKLCFFIGHSFLFLVMVMSSLFASNGLYMPMICLWVLTGIGGGTVYAIPQLTCKYKKTDLKLSEDLGHVLGVVVAIAAYTILGRSCELAVFLALSAFFVAITLVLATIDIIREKRKRI